VSYRFADSLQAGSGWNCIPSWSCSQSVSKPVWHIPLLCVQWETPDDGQRNCPKHVEFHSKNKFQKLVHLFGFIIRNLTRCTVTWTSDSKINEDVWEPRAEKKNTWMQAKWNSVTSSQGALSFVSLTNILKMIIPKYMKPGRRSLYSGWATGLTINVSITGKGKRFFPFPKPPRQVWNPPNLLFGGYSNEQSYTLFMLPLYSYVFMTWIAATFIPNIWFWW